MSVRVMAIDPGLEGGIAFAEIGDDLATYDRAFAVRMPLPDYDRDCDNRPVLPLGFRSPDASEIGKIVRTLQPDFVVIEHVGTDSKFRADAAWTFGVGFGQLLGAVSAAFDDDVKRIVLVRPKRWQAHFGRGKDKQRSIDDARALFPGLEFKGDGPAEALLLIEYFRAAIIPSGEVEVM